MRPSYSRHYASCPVRPSVHPSVMQGLKETHKNQNYSVDVPHHTSEWGANFQFERSKVKGHRTKNPQKSNVIFTYGRQCRQIKHGRRRLHAGLRHC